MAMRVEYILQFVDGFIRTRNRFYSRSPTTYSIQLHTLLSDKELLEKFDEILDYPELPYRNLRC